MPDGQTWAQLQLGYSKAARILEKAHAGCVHPQRRPAVQIAVVAALARLLEVRHILMDIPGYETAIASAAKEMKMSPPDWEIYVPRGFREERAEVMTLAPITTLILSRGPSPLCRGLARSFAIAAHISVTQLR